MLAAMPLVLPSMISVVALLLGAGAAYAQTSAFVAAGAVFPVSDFAAIADPGPAVAAGVVLEGVVPRLVVGAEGSYGWAEHTLGDARSDVYSVMAFAGYPLSGLGTLEVTPLAGLGGIAHARRSEDFPGLDATRAGLGAMIGLRLAFPVGRLRGFAAGSYASGIGDMNSDAFPTETLLLTAGVTIR